ncbi:MAG: helix-turn-helix domain-containing protein [Novosphingobium sp.]
MKNELISRVASSDGGKARPTAGTAACDAVCDRHVIADEEVPLGTRLRDLRKQMGLSQAKFAEALGCTRRTLLTYETLRREPPFRVIREAARQGDLSIDELTLGAEEASRYRLRAWQQAEALKQRLIELASLKGFPLDMDSDRWNRVLQILLANGANVGGNERLLEIFLILQTSDRSSAPDIGEWRQGAQ